MKVFNKHVWLVLLAVMTLVKLMVD